MPRITRVLETALYVDDLDRAVGFYRGVMALRVLFLNPRMAALDAGQGTVLLLFRRGASAAGAGGPDGWIPPHDGAGPAHFAFAIQAEDLAEWEAHLAAHRVTVESQITWERGGTSVYFRDPDGHSVELATPGVWETY
ncbi:MAG: VOC family protein [Planctomycetota bacterium]